MDYLGHQDYLVHQLQAGVSDRLDTTNANLAATNANLATTNANLEITNATLANVDSRVSSIENLTTDVNERIDAIDGRVDSIDTKVDNVDTKITNVDLKVDALADNVYTKSQVEGIEDNLLTQLGNLNTDVSGVRSLITNTKTEVNKKIDDHIGNITTSGADAHFTTGEKKKFSDLLTDIKSYAKTDALNNYYTKVEIEDYLHDNYLMTIPDEYVTESELNVALGNQLNSDDVAGSYYNKSEIDDYFSSYATTAWATSLINTALNTSLRDYVTVATYNTDERSRNLTITGIQNGITTINDEITDLNSALSLRLSEGDVKYLATTTASDSGSYEIGRIKVKNSEYVLRGKNTTYDVQGMIDTAIDGIVFPEFPEPHIPEDPRTLQGVVYVMSNDKPDTPIGGVYNFNSGVLDTTGIQLKVNGTAVSGKYWSTNYIKPTVTQRVWTSSALFIEELDNDDNRTGSSKSNVYWFLPTEVVDSEVLLERVPISNSYGVSVYASYKNGTPPTPEGGTFDPNTATLTKMPTSTGVTWKASPGELDDSNSIWVSYNNYITTVLPSEGTNASVNIDYTGWTTPVKYIDIAGAIQSVKEANQQMYQKLIDDAKQEIDNYVEQTKNAYTEAAEEYTKAQELLDTIESGDMDMVGMYTQISQLRGEIRQFGWSTNGTITPLPPSSYPDALKTYVTSTPYFTGTNVTVKYLYLSSNVTVASGQFQALSITFPGGIPVTGIVDFSTNYDGNLVVRAAQDTYNGNNLIANAGDYLAYGNESSSSSTETYLYFTSSQRDPNIGNIKVTVSTAGTYNIPSPVAGVSAYDSKEIYTKVLREKTDTEDELSVFFTVRRVPGTERMYYFPICDSRGVEDALGRSLTYQNSLFGQSNRSSTTYRIVFYGQPAAVLEDGVRYVNTLFSAIESKWGVKAADINAMVGSYKSGEFVVTPEKISAIALETVTNELVSYAKKSELSVTSNLIRSDVYRDYGNIVDASYIQLTPTSIVLSALSGSNVETLYYLDFSPINGTNVANVVMGVTAIKMSNVYVNSTYSSMSFLCRLYSSDNTDICLRIIAGSYKDGSGDNKDLTDFYVWVNESGRLEVYKPDIDKPQYAAIYLNIDEASWKNVGSMTIKGETVTGCERLGISKAVANDDLFYVVRYRNKEYDQVRNALISITNREIALSIVGKQKGAAFKVGIAGEGDNESSYASLDAEEFVITGQTIANAIATEDLNVGNCIYLFGNKNHDNGYPTYTDSTYTSTQGNGTFHDFTYKTAKYDTLNGKDSIGTKPTAGTAWFAAGTNGMTIFNTDGTGQLAGGLIQWGNGTFERESNQNTFKFTKNNSKQFGMAVSGTINAYAGHIGDWVITGKDSTKSDSVGYIVSDDEKLVLAPDVLHGGTKSDGTYGWCLNADGSGYLAHNQIYWYYDGPSEKWIITLPEVNVNAKLYANSMIGKFVGIGTGNGEKSISENTENINATDQTHQEIAKSYGLSSWFNLNGSGAIANGNIYWDENGNTNILSRISPEYFTVTKDNFNNVFISSSGGGAGSWVGINQKRISTSNGTVKRLGGRKSASNVYDSGYDYKGKSWSDQRLPYFTFITKTGSGPSIVLGEDTNNNLYNGFSDSEGKLEWVINSNVTNCCMDINYAGGLIDINYAPDSPSYVRVFLPYYYPYGTVTSSKDDAIKEPLGECLRTPTTLNTTASGDMHYATLTDFKMITGREMTISNNTEKVFILVGLFDVDGVIGRTLTLRERQSVTLKFVCRPSKSKITSIETTLVGSTWSVSTHPTEYVWVATYDTQFAVSAKDYDHAFSEIDQDS